VRKLSADQKTGSVETTRPGHEPRGKEVLAMMFMPKLMPMRFSSTCFALRGKTCGSG